MDKFYEWVEEIEDQKETELEFLVDSYMGDYWQTEEQIKKLIDSGERMEKKQKQEQQKITEHLIKCAEKVARAEEKYLAEKHKLDIVKAGFILQDLGEKIGKAKPTQKEKDAYIELQVKEIKGEVNDLKVKSDYYKRIYEINLLNEKRARAKIIPQG